MFTPRLLLSMLLAATSAATSAGAQPMPAAPSAAPATEARSLADFVWIARPLVIFADSPNDPRYAQQLSMLETGRDDLAERHVVILTDTDPAANGPLRQALRPRDFGLVLIDIDGTIAQRRPSPTSARELINLIDRMPSRRQESGSRRR